MTQFITIPSTDTGFATATDPNGGPIQVNLNYLFDIKQTATTTTVIYFDNRLGAGQKTLTLTHTATAGTLPIVANAIYEAINANPGGNLVPVALPVGIVITNAVYA